MPRRLPAVAILRWPLALGISLLPAAGCRSAQPGPPEITVGASDYAYQMPKEMMAGPTLFRMENRGKVSHEMALGQLKAGVTAESVLAYAAQGKSLDDLADGVVGILIAGPGESALGTLRADLVPGRTYMMICQFRDADSLPPHLAMGMQASFVAK